MERRAQLLEMGDKALLALCKMDRFRASGPGGQHRNKTDSAVRLTLNELPEISAEADESRSQHQNREEALRRLRLAIAYGIRSDEPARPCTGQLKFNARNPEYVFFVANILDALHQNDWRLGDAARAVKLSRGKFSKALFIHPDLWNFLNQLREKQGRTPLSPPR